jgi:hypothetical protein
VAADCGDLTSKSRLADPADSSLCFSFRLRSSPAVQIPIVALRSSDSLIPTKCQDPAESSQFRSNKYRSRISISGFSVVQQSCEARRETLTNTQGVRLRLAESVFLAQSTSPETNTCRPIGSARSTLTHYRGSQTFFIFACVKCKSFVCLLCSASSKPRRIVGILSSGHRVYIILSIHHSRSIWSCTLVAWSTGANSSSIAGDECTSGRTSRHITNKWRFSDRCQLSRRAVHTTSNDPDGHNNPIIALRASRSHHEWNAGDHDFRTTHIIRCGDHHFPSVK